MILQGSAGAVGVKFPQFIEFDWIISGAGSALSEPLGGLEPESGFAIDD